MQLNLSKISWHHLHDIQVIYTDTANMFKLNSQFYISE